MQALAARVETKRGIVVGNMDVQPQVGIGHRDVGTNAGLLAELVHDGVLHLIGHELRVTEILREHHGVDGKCLLLVQIVRPVDGFYLVVDIVGAACLEMLDGLQDSDGCMQLEVGAVHQFLVAGERHHAASYFHIVCSQVCEFFSQDGLQSHESFGYEFEFHYLNYLIEVSLLFFF